ncbi:MAG: hypothetical protein HOM36_01615 [Phycisphaerae bacterium]|nr:hypothetical protein [Phycisphaerae bacterium]
MSKAKRFIWICVVLLFAGSISWWSSKNESGVAYHIQEEVLRLVPRFAENPNIIEAVVVDPLLQSILATTLQKALRRADAQGLSIVVVVSDGDSDFYGDGTATHVASLEVGQQVIGGLRIVCMGKEEPLRIAGVFTGSEQ